MKADNRIDGSRPTTNLLSPPRESLNSDLTTAASMTLHLFIDSLVIFVWLAIQWAFYTIIGYLLRQDIFINPIVSYTVTLSQYIFTVGTFIFVLAFLIRDVSAALILIREDIVRISQASFRKTEGNIDDRTVQLEYRVRELEGILDWALDHDVSVKDVSVERIKEIQQQALDQVRRRYPDIDVEIKGQLPL